MSNATELLNRALNSLNNLEDQLKDLGYGWLGGPQLREEIETFLATEPETEEPVAWINTNSAVNNKLKQKPISLHPPRHSPSRKPMTEEEILGAARDHYNPYQRAEISFARAIERHHGIGGGDE